MSEAAQAAPLDTARCLDDVTVLALIEQRLAGAARELACGHLEACRACLELVAALLRCVERSV